VIEGWKRSFAWLVVSSVALLPAGARGEESARAEGTIQIGTGRAEVLSRKVPVGKRIELPEGWFRVEEEGPEDGRVGSFTIVASRDEDDAAPEPALEAAPPATARVLAPPPPAEVAPPQRPASPAPAQACRAERSAYLRQLWKESGIEVSDPDALLEGLDAGNSGPATGYFWFALATDAFRNLASSSDLRGRAEALVRCIQSARRDAP
jgi:hypothetical protein